MKQEEITGPECFLLCALVLEPSVCQLELDFSKWKRRDRASQTEDDDLGLWSARAAWDAGGKKRNEFFKNLKHLGRECSSVVECLPAAHNASRGKQHLRCNTPGKIGSTFQF